MKKLSEYLFLWATGGCIYYAFELLFRGFSHWTMFALGGTCFVFFYVQGSATNWQDSLLRQLVRCVVFVTSLEFITGIIANKWLKLHIWDYEGQPFNIFGQVCLPFTIIFAGLSLLGILLSGYLLYWLYDEKKPACHIL